MTGRSAVARGILAACLGLLTLPGPSASAGPIRAYRVHAERTGPALGPAWGRFLADGPGLWSVAHAPRFPSGIHLASVSGRLVETPFVDYLLWRRSLDPARFDHFHPFVGPRLAALDSNLSAASIPTIQSQSLVPPPPLKVSPETITPEPGSLAISVGLLGAGAWWRRRWSPPSTTP